MAAAEECAPQLSEIKNALTLSDFDCISSKVLNEFILQIGDQPFQIAEVEFYLRSQKHNDTFSHCDQVQLDTCGQWYFHRQNGKSFKGGTYKGLDLTFGIPGVEHGGMLVRSIKDLTTGELIEGPCKSVDKMLEITGFASIADLHGSDRFSMDALASENIIKLVPCEKEVRTDIIVYGPRVGLTLKKTDEFKPKFIMSPYRHYVFPNLIKKQKTLTMLQAFESKMDDVPRIFGVHPSKVLDLMGKLEAAKKEEQFISFFEGKQLKADDLINLFAMVHA